MPSIEFGEASRLPALFRDLPCQSFASKKRRDLRADTNWFATVVSSVIPQFTSPFFLRAAAMSTKTLLKFILHIRLPKFSDDRLGH